MGKFILVAAILIALVGVFAINKSVNHNNRTRASLGTVDIMDNHIPMAAEPVDIDTLIEEKDLSTIYLAGGCFWGVEEYMSRIAGVYDSTSGYANGNTENPSYEDVIYAGTGHAETVKVVYDSNQVGLDELLDKFFKVVDPTSLNQQGNDIGTQYRSGVYYVDPDDKAIIDKKIAELSQLTTKDIVVEVEPLDNFYNAEDYHQDYLQKNPNGYCHINLSAAVGDQLIDPNDYVKPDSKTIKANLSAIAYDVTQYGGTERAFTHEYDKNYELGLYVDIVTGEPLFLSTDKYDSGTGWPSFTQPITDDVIIEDTHGASLFYGTEVKSRSGKSHLGHVFTDGPKDSTGLRYCINGAALKFIPYNNMVEEGYGYLQFLLD